ncbi:alpha/beta fold hydrolase [Pseudoduganella sp. UC29_106]|uniref:alpha/beta fold hydrolase n=1 Tax=Pseudoduganella sp. UC29_106 TaxID=3374553 RepID=UPI00375730DF
MKPAVVLLHSSLSSRNQWSALMAAHSEQYRFIALDLLGYGKSAFPTESAAAGYTLAHEADAVAATLASHLDAGEPFHLVGHSYGGATALRLARQLRERVLSLTVFEPVAFHLLQRNDAARMEIEAFAGSIAAAEREEDATRIFIDYWNRPGVFDALPDIQRQRFMSQIAKVKLDFIALLGEPATLDDAAQLGLPALVMAGRKGPSSTRRVAEQLAAALPNGSFMETAGGHMGPITDAEAVNEAIIGFLSACTADQFAG